MVELLKFLEDNPRILGHFSFDLSQFSLKKEVVSLQLRYLFFLVVFLLRLGHMIIDNGICITLGDFDLIDEGILFFDCCPHLFPEGLELEPDVVDVIVNLFFKLVEDVGQMLLFELAYYLLHKGFGT